MPPSALTKSEIVILSFYLTGRGLKLQPASSVFQTSSSLYPASRTFSLFSDLNTVSSGTSAHFPACNVCHNQKIADLRELVHGSLLFDNFDLRCQRYIQNW